MPNGIARVSIATLCEGGVLDSGRFRHFMFVRRKWWNGQVCNRWGNARFKSVESDSPTGWKWEPFRSLCMKPSNLALTKALYKETRKARYHRALSHHAATFSFADGPFCWNRGGSVQPFEISEADARAHHLLLGRTRNSDFGMQMLTSAITRSWHEATRMFHIALA